MRSKRWRAIAKAEKHLFKHEVLVLHAEEKFGLKCVLCPDTRKYKLVIQYFE